MDITRARSKGSRCASPHRYGVRRVRFSLERSRTVGSTPSRLRSRNMKANLRTIGMIALGTSVLGACATKGFVRTAVRDERAARIAGDSANARDINGVRSDVATLRTDVASLRNDLTALRTEFGAKITAMEDGLKFAFPVNFAYDDATVREADHAALARFAGVAQKYYNGSVITVEGFADPAGSQRYNLDLSKRRADAVAAYL